MNFLQRLLFSAPHNARHRSNGEENRGNYPPPAPAYGVFLAGFGIAVLLLLQGCTADKNWLLNLQPGQKRTIAFDASALRGVWVQAKSITTADKIDRMLDRAEAGHFNTVFVNVFAYGRPFYDSKLVEKAPKVAAEFNPLAYLVPEARQRNIQVHAWFVVGDVGAKNGMPILEEHPEWRMIGPDGKETSWLNYTRPDVRQFIGDLMLETIEIYDVDGIHFDYTRYPSSEWGFDPYSIEQFNLTYGFDLNELKYSDLPAYAIFESNPLVNPKTAQVLAQFANGSPAVTLNKFGDGEVILLNWDASRRRTAIGSEIMQRSVQRLLDEGGSLYLLYAEPTIAQYGTDTYDRANAWLSDLGWPVETATEVDIQTLLPNSVLVLPGVYLISPSGAVALAEFVHNGGGVIVVDGPTRSINLPQIQAITGMASRGRYFKEETLMTVAQNHSLIPASNRILDMQTAEERDNIWRKFREHGINVLLEEVYQRTKTVSPEVEVSITITGKQDKAEERYLLDWKAWLEGEYVDFIVPRGYVQQIKDLGPFIAAWNPVVEDYGRTIFGLKAYIAEGDEDISKTNGQLLREVDIARTAGSNGVIIFDLEHISDDQLQELAGDANWFPDE